MIDRAQREAVTDHDALDVVIEQHRDQRVLEARHDDDVVDEVVLRPAQFANPLAQAPRLLVAALVDEQHLEVGPLVMLLVVELFVFLGVVLDLRAQVDRARAVGAAGQRAHDAADDPRERAEILCSNRCHSSLMSSCDGNAL